MGAQESRSVSKFYVEGLIPALWSKMEALDNVGVGDGYVGSGVHYAGFVDGGGHSWGDGRCVF